MRMVMIEDIKKMVALQLGRRAVAADDRIVEDLGAESVDVVNIVARIEDRYGITIEEERLPEIETVGNLCECVERKCRAGGN